MGRVKLQGAKVTFRRISQNVGEGKKNSISKDELPFASLLQESAPYKIESELELKLDLA